MPDRKPPARERSGLTLVTGGAGFIGSHVVAGLLAAGQRVRVLDNLSTGRQSRLPADPRLEFVTGDVRDRRIVMQTMTGAEQVVHLAAQVFVSVSMDDPPGSAEHNIIGFLNVLQQAKTLGVRRLVYASSVAVYGNPARLPLSEDMPATPVSPYGLEKRVNEEYAALFGRVFGFPSLGLRLANIYGPRQDPSSPYSGVISRFVRQMREHQPITLYGSGEQTRDFVYVGDVAEIVVAALASDYHGVCNVGRGEPVSLLEVIDTLSAIAGYRPPLLHGPARAGDVMYSYCDAGRLQAALGLRPEIPLHEGLRRLFHEQSSPVAAAP